MHYSKAYKKDNPLRFQIEGFLLLGCVGVKLSSPNISFKACSCSSKPTSFATRVALSVMWSISAGLVHKRWTSCNLLLVPFNRIPHFRKRFSLSSLVSLFCICLASICLSWIKAFLLLTEEIFYLGMLAEYTYINMTWCGNEGNIPWGGC